MEYISSEKRINYLLKEEFDQFFADAIDIVFKAKENPSTQSMDSLANMLYRHKVVLKMPDDLFKQVAPAFDMNLYAPTAVGTNACPACSACGLCSLCAEVNGAVGAAFLAAVVALFNSSEASASSLAAGRTM